MWLPRLLEPEPAPFAVAVDGAALTLAGQRVPLPGELRALVRLLGEPSYTVELANRISVWDELGLAAYRPPGGGRVFEVSILIGELCGVGFWPRRPFPGRVTLDGAAVVPGGTVEQINSAKSGLPLVHSGGGCCWTIDHGGSLIAVTTKAGLVAMLTVEATEAEQGRCT